MRGSQLFRLNVQVHYIHGQGSDTTLSILMEFSPSKTCLLGSAYLFMYSLNMRINFSFLGDSNK